MELMPNSLQEYRHVAFNSLPIYGTTAVSQQEVEIAMGIRIRATGGVRRQTRVNRGQRVG